MTYQEIQQISDLEEKEIKLIEFYLKDIEILNWLKDNTKNKKILYSDRIEYKVGNMLHNVDGPAIEKHNGEKEYYIHGKLMSLKEWETVAKTLKRHKALKAFTE